jgi:hypothetical protein
MNKLKIHQINIKINFLNGSLDKKMYMKQPYVLVIK